MRVGIFGGRLRGAYKTCDNVVWLMLKEDLSISYMPQGSNSSTKMPIPVNFPTAVAVENKVFVLGGQNSDNQTVKVVQIYDGGSDNWKLGPEMPVGQCCHGACNINTEIYVVGSGCGSDKVTLRLDTRVGLWQRLPDPEFAHAFLPIVPISGQIYAAGGGVVQLERFDPASNSWTTLAAMKEERLNHFACCFSEELYVFGGKCVNSQGAVTLNSASLYSPRSNTWNSLPEMPKPLSEGGLFYSEEHAFIIDGSASGESQNVFIFDSKKGCWSSTNLTPGLSTVNFGIAKLAI